MEFSRRELRDLAIAWLALGVAFTVFIEPGVRGLLLGRADALAPRAAVVTFVGSLLTVGVGFLLHELAHKIVAVRFGQIAAFRADYNMLLLAVLGGLVGFLFAAPGAVVHRGRISARENGLISAAGPLTNVVLAVAFVGLTVAAVAVNLPDVVVTQVFRGVTINVLLAGFNMIPFGPLDGRKVLDWSLPAYVAIAVVTIGPAVAFFFVGF